jgi:transposase InsO family protein
MEDIPRGSLGRAGGGRLFTVEVLTLTGLVRYVVLFVMKLKTRTVEIAGITRLPDEDWMTQVARNLTDADEGFYSGVFRNLLRASGVKPLLLPPRSPTLNACAERLIRTLMQLRIGSTVLLKLYN